MARTSVEAWGLDRQGRRCGRVRYSSEFYPQDERTAPTPRTTKRRPICAAIERGCFRQEAAVLQAHCRRTSATKRAAVNATDNLGQRSGGKK